MQLDIDLYDTSDYPCDHALYSKRNAEVVGKFKDKLNGVAALEFIGLWPKMYSLLLPERKSKNTAKGVLKSFIRKHITNDLYRQCLHNKMTTTATFHTIRSSVHQLKTLQLTKKTLSPYDDMRHLSVVSGESLAHGHKDIAKLRNFLVN